MIGTFKAENYGCLKNVTAELTPLHAFIGPNDSGKSTLLRGIRTLSQLAGGSFVRDSSKGLQPFDPALPVGVKHRGTVFLAAEVQAGRYWLNVTEGRIEETAHHRGGGDSFSAARSLTDTSDFMKSDDLAQILAELGGARLLRLDPDALRRPSGLIAEPDSRALAFLDERGSNLPGILYGLREYDSPAFASIEEHIRELFPTVKAVRLPPATSSTLAIEVELKDGSRARAAEVSEGLLYSLAFLVLPHLAHTSVLLVEEPENGLHPARVGEVIRLLRAFVDQTGTQVLIATHSPLVVNELTPDEVTIVTRPSLEEGTRLTPIRQTHNFEHRAGVYSLGELWLSYSDGKQEAPLFDARKQ